MIQQWINENGNHDIPSHLANLVASVRVELKLSALHTAGTNETGVTLPLQLPMKGPGREFVLMGVWPFQGSRHGLTLGKERVKQRINKFGGTITLSISSLTDTLVVGDCSGKKKILEADKRSLKIITIYQLNNLILGDLILEDLTPADYPSSVSVVLDA